MPTYDLCNESWIPVRFTDGSHGAVGLRNALKRAHEIYEISVDNPMEVAALNRLLLTLTVRIMRGTEEADCWFDTWDSGSFDMAMVDDYFEQWRDRFDLFHTKNPFYQVRTNIGQGLLPVGLLRLDEGRNTSSLFSHDDLMQDAMMRPDEAARGLVASQHAAIGGLLSNPYKTGNKHSPAVGGAIFWLCGASLFHSLLLNAPPDPKVRMGGRSDSDSPSWECDESIVQERRPHHGFLDYLTFQHRRITLSVQETDSGLMVDGIWRTGGNAEEPMPLDDPHMAIINGDEANEPRRYNVQTGKAVWRDAHVFLTLVSERGTPPRTFIWANANSTEIGLNQLDVEVFALRTRGANDGTIKIWRQERLPLFLNLLADPDRGRQVVIALERVHAQASNLSSATLIAAARLRTPTKDHGELSSNEKEDAKKLARSIDTESRYWSTLDAHFYTLLQQLACAPQADTDPDWATASMNDWIRRIHRAALHAYDTATRSLTANARQLRAIAEGRGAIHPISHYSGNATSSVSASPTIMPEVAQ